MRPFNSKIAINFGAVLNSINADDFFAVINPVKDPPITNAKLAKACQIVRHSDEPAMDHHGGIFSKPKDFAFDTCADGGIEFSKLCVGSLAYFDPVGHDKWRGFQGLNLPASSSLRASCNSAMTLGFCAVSQS